MIERKFLVVGLHKINDKIALELKYPMEKEIRPEEHILPEREEERIAVRMVEAMMKPLVREMRRSIPGGPPAGPRLQLLITKEEYEAIERPTLDDILVLRTEISVKRQAKQP